MEGQQNKSDEEQWREICANAITRKTDGFPTGKSIKRKKQLKSGWVEYSYQLTQGQLKIEKEKQHQYYLARKAKGKPAE